MNRRIERILLGLMILILVVVLTNETTRIKLEAWNIRLDIFTTDSEEPVLLNARMKEDDAL